MFGKWLIILHGWNFFYSERNAVPQLRRRRKNRKIVLHRRIPSDRPHEVSIASLSEGESCSPSSAFPPPHGIIMVAPRFLLYFVSSRVCTRSSRSRPNATEFVISEAALIALLQPRFPRYDTTRTYHARPHTLSLSLSRFHLTYINLRSRPDTRGVYNSDNVFP